VFWGIGHTATLFIIGIIVILMKGEITDIRAMSLEFLVGIMLVYLGIASILSFQKILVHKHEHDGEEHKHVHAHTHRGEHEHRHQHKDISYVKSLLIGFVHGLAGSAAMMCVDYNRKRKDR
jgi:ABC-type nickel/cobalt efflux system permease component RcnA